MGKGFNGRIFLTREEHATYLRRMPVRFVRHKKEEVCSVCGEPEKEDNRFENSHVIPFRIGVVALALTPDFLDEKENIRTAHKRKCNRAVELSLDNCVAEVVRRTERVRPPWFPSKDVRDVWMRVLSRTS